MEELRNKIRNILSKLFTILLLSCVDGLDGEAHISEAKINMTTGRTYSRKATLELGGWDRQRFDNCHMEEILSQQDRGTSACGTPCGGRAKLSQLHLCFSCWSLVCLANESQHQCTYAC